MSLQFLSLASGSSGNCYYLGNEEYGILIDAGKGVRTIKKVLKEYGIPFEKIVALCITHDHADHIKAAGTLGEKYGIPIYTTEAIKNGSEVIGNRTRAKIVKNKCAPPFKEAYFDIMYGEGISKWGELVDLAVQLDLINKSGSWFSIGDERIGQGRDSAKQYLIDHPDVADRIEQEIRDNMWKLQGKNAKPPASVAAKPVSISADDFNDD